MTWLARRRRVATTLLALSLGGSPLVARAEDAPTTPQQTLGRTHINLRGNDLPLGNVLVQIARSAKLALIVDKDVQLSRPATFSTLEDLPLDTALAVVLTPLGYSYEVDEKRAAIRVYVYATHTFHLGLPVVSHDWIASVANTGGVSGGAAVIGGGGAAQIGGSGPSGALGARIGLSARSDTAGVWEEVEHGLTRLLGADMPGSGGGGQGPTDQRDRTPALGAYSINRAAGLVVVRALPSVMPAIESYFDALNTEMGRTVSIETKVIEVEINHSTSAGIDWNLLGARIGNLLSIGAGVPRTSALSGIVTGTTNMPTLHVSTQAGDVFVRALEEQGKVKILAQPTLALGNNVPALVQLSEVRTYVAQQITTVVQGAASAQVTVQTDSVQDGLTISILPRVLENGEVSMALATILQDIVAINQSNFAGGFIQLPDVKRRAYNGVVRAKVGEMVAIGGLITTRKERIRTGIPFLSQIPIIGFIFGGMQDVDRRSELIIAVTPREIQAMPAQAPYKGEAENELTVPPKP